MRSAVLVVDDSEFVRQTLGRALLAHEDFEVLLAQNGKEALKILDQNHAVRLMVLDLRMPIVDGREVLRRLGDGRPRPSFIVAVGDHDDEAALAECRRLGASQTLTKPLDVECLVTLLRRALHEQDCEPRR